MKAIEILFEEVDKINAQIKTEQDISKKISLSLEIRDVIDIIERISKHRYESNYNQLWNKDYL